MRYFRTALILALTLGFVSVSTAETPQEQVFDRHAFPRFETAHYLCWQRLLGRGGEMAREMLTTTAPLAEVTSFYTERLGKEALTQVEEGWTWRLPVGAQEPDRTLSLYPVTAHGPWKSCSEPIPADAQTIILLSSRTERKSGTR